MAGYELVYIVNPEVTDEDLSGLIDRVSQSISKVGGNVIEVNKWGRKRMAYPIKKCTEGNYVLTKLELDPAAIKDLEANIRLSDEVIRHLMIRV